MGLSFCRICAMNVLEELHVAILLVEMEGSFCGTMSCNETIGEVSSIFAMFSMVEPWLCTGVTDDSYDCDLSCRVHIQQLERTICWPTLNHMIIVIYYCWWS